MGIEGKTIWFNVRAVFPNGKPSQWTSTRFTYKSFCFAKRVPLKNYTHTHTHTHYHILHHTMYDGVQVKNCEECRVYDKHCLLKQFNFRIKG